LAFIYTVGHHLYVYKYNPERPSIGLQFVAHEEFDQYQSTDDEGVFLMAMEYV